MRTQEEISELNRLDQLIYHHQNHADAYKEKRREVERQADRREYSCSCVVLAKELGIWDMPSLERAGRECLGLGQISEHLTALRACPKCHGRGKR